MRENSDPVKALIDSIAAGIAHQLWPSIRDQMIALANNSTSKKVNDEKYLTRQQVADVFGITLMTVDSWTRRGKLKGYRVGRKVRYKSSEIDSVLKPINN